VFNLETNTVVESCDVTFDESTHYPHDVFECVGDKEIKESILQGFDGDEDDPLCPSTSSSELVFTFTLEAEAPQTITSFTTVVEVSWVEGEIISNQGAPSHI
jgi:hypothetical protein